MRRFEVFVSHSSRDKKFVRELMRAFRSHRIDFWCAPYHLVGSQRWHDEIGRALARCDWLLIVLTPDSVESTWVGHEVRYALSMPRYDGRIIPVLRKECDLERLSWTLKAIQWVDFRRDFDQGCRDLARVFGIRRFSVRRKTVRRKPGPHRGS